ncbi:GHKL domain-containing protein [Sphingomonas ginsenosidivorax]|uniref:histidine kinase n=1 Tax=Sphingomonas ginsenosidivorax TaxID=862135 RepID=A0A5C6UBM0_9SPHN|nr:ATP-binding protein [Sphingomonas ginsenosidivorax]TXC69621.1 GHKL domain-containing protein [Sphingomonas ginsenosidivorax]
MNRLWEALDDRPSVHPVPFGSAIRVGCLAACAALATSLTIRTVFHYEWPFIFGFLTTLAASLRASWRAGIVGAVLVVVGGVLLFPDAPLVTEPIVMAVIGCYLILAVTGDTLRQSRLTEHALAQQIRQRETYLQAIFATLPAAMLIVNDSGIIVTANQCAEQLFKHRHEPLAGCSISALLNLPNNGSAIGHLAKQVAIGQMTGQTVCIPVSGAHPLELTMQLAEVPISGKPFHIVYLRDETPQRTADARRAGLEAQVQQLGRATALGQLGSAIAHELNQPLASAALYAGAVRMMLADPDHDKAEVDATVVDMLGQLFRAKTIFQRLRNFVAADELDMEWVDVRRIVLEASQLGRMAIRQASAHLTVVLDEEFGEVFVDPVQIQQVLLNLIVNGVEAVQDRPVREVTLSVARWTDRQLVISVSDTGYGIADEVRNRLFEPFATSKRHGLGVGLSISKSIVEHHQGELWYDHEQPETTFRFTLGYRPTDAVGVAA